MPKTATITFSLFILSFFPILLFSFPIPYFRPYRTHTKKQFFGPPTQMATHFARSVFKNPAKHTFVQSSMAVDLLVMAPHVMFFN